uniref:Protein Hook homolog 3-like n=1 Tax=Saccoglossus kowalevskii TaxID=10224 RepID=A0ABM0MWD3_SACKO|nr:PREDICTED: protein Hook homolog 3-like [Saccoglossus kowalevskii]
MSSVELCESLMIWLQTFEIRCKHETVNELTDGVAICEVLCQIAPSFFDANWFGRIKQGVGDNWRLKVSNLKKVLKGILDYQNDILGQQIYDYRMPDVNAIGEREDPEELGRLLQLTLGCAVNCDHKEKYINIIMGMEEAVQVVVMNAIQELMTKEKPMSQAAEDFAEIEQQLKRALEDVQRIQGEKEEIVQRCHELDTQVASLAEEKQKLHAENERLSEKIEQGEGLDDPTTPVGRRYQQLQNQVEQLQEENYRLEAQREDFRIKAEVQEKEIIELAQKNEELATLADEARTLNDELDILRHTSDKVSKYEATIESYKKKLEELSDLKRQLKLLEEKNTVYMQTNIDLEDELKKSGSYRSQVDMYKRQLHELHVQLTEETQRADKAEFEQKRLQEKTEVLSREKVRLMSERDALQECNDELTVSHLERSPPRSPDTLHTSTSPILGDMVTPDIKEKLLRLQHENKILKLERGESSDGETQLLRSLLEDANVRKSELELHNRSANQRIMQLEAELEELKLHPPSNKVVVSSSETTELKRKLQDYMEKVREMDVDIMKKNAYIDDLEPKVANSDDEIQALQEMLNRKDEDMRAMEDRYKKYLDKAKSVIRTLDPKQNPGAAPEVQALKNQLTEKQKLIEHLENDREKTKSVKEVEEKLIVSAWYNLGMQLHRKAAEERLANSATGQSFLARQRQASTRRSQTITTGSPNNGAR